MTKLAFVDTETTGLNPDRHEIWELGIILGDSEQPHAFTEQLWHFPVNRAEADPTALRIGRFYERSIAEGAPELVKVIGDAAAATRYTASVGAARIAIDLDGAHLVGAVVDFDARFLTRWLNRHGQAATWHYHLVDVEALAVGFVAGLTRAANDHREGADAEKPPLPIPKVAMPPWDSNRLSRAIGVDPDDFDRHTALGDARWAKAIYDKVMHG